MRRLIIQLGALAALSTLCACGPTPTAYTVVLVDASRSITREGFRSEFNAVDSLVDQMHRGDRLTIIPITSNVAAEAPGHVLTLSAPARRQAYDADLTEFRKDAHGEVAKLRDGLTANPAKQTDILGALDIAQEAFAANTEDAGTSDPRQSLFVFSDFIEDDRTVHFTLASGVFSREVSNALAARLRREHQFALSKSVNVKLIMVQSSDAKRLDAHAHDWIRTFWSQYLMPCNVRWALLDVAAVDEKAAIVGTP